jgi:hypothetical protein
MVDAGNALLRGERSGTVRLSVTGYKGVGKSSLIIHALRMLREPTAAPGAMRAERAPEVARFCACPASMSAAIDGLPDDLHRSVLELLTDTVHEAEHGASEVPPPAVLAQACSRRRERELVRQGPAPP